MFIYIHKALLLTNSMNPVNCAFAHMSPLCLLPYKIFKKNYTRTLTLEQ